MYHIWKYPTIKFADNTIRDIGKMYSTGNYFVSCNFIKFFI